jgi:hypothetical protein
MREMKIVKHLVSRFFTSMFIIFIAAGVHAAPIAYWSFDEPSGQAIDTIGGHNGTLVGSVTRVPGIAGSAISLSQSTGEPEYVTMGDVLALGGMDYSISVWINTTDTSDDTMLVSKHYATIVSGYILAINMSSSYGAPDKAWFYNEWTGWSPTSNTTVTDGSWHHIVGVHDEGGNVSIYVDGAMEDSDTDHGLGDPPSGTPLIFGGCWDGSTVIEHYNGLIDDVQIYNNALTGDEVRYLYANPGKTIVVPEPSTMLLLGLGLMGVAGIRRKLST